MAGGCSDPPSERSVGHAEPSAHASTSVENEPVAVRLNGREVRVRCEVSCEPLGAELGRLLDGCRTDPLSAPHLLSAGGASLAGLGCCTEAEAAYRAACGFDGELSRCGSEWAARCARGGT